MEDLTKNNSEDQQLTASTDFVTSTKGDCECVNAANADNETNSQALTADLAQSKTENAASTELNKPTEPTEPNKPINPIFEKAKKVLSYIFIDGLSGMAVGLFATLIIGTIICQIGKLIPGFVGIILNSLGTAAEILMGAGIGIGVALKLKKKPMVTVSAGVAGLIGAFASKIIESANSGKVFTVYFGVGEPLGAFVAAFVAIEVGSLVAGKTKVDIIVTPLVSIFSGSIIGLLAGPPISVFMTAVGNLIAVSMVQQPVIMGILVAALMGVALTLPISSAAIGISLGLSGLAAGSAVVGCCCQMVGFAVMSFRENKWGGLIAQGLGTSMLQMPNLIKHPICWLPPVLSSMILGPISATVFKMTASKIGSGMGTAGLVGPLDVFATMVEGGVGVLQTLGIIALLLIVLPAALTLLFSEIMRKLGWIKSGDLKLDL